VHFNVVDEKKVRLKLIKEHKCLLRNRLTKETMSNSSKRNAVDYISKRDLKWLHQEVQVRSSDAYFTLNDVSYESITGAFDSRYFAENWYIKKLFWGKLVHTRRELRKFGYTAGGVIRFGPLLNCVFLRKGRFKCYNFTFLLK